MYFKLLSNIKVCFLLKSVYYIHLVNSSASSVPFNNIILYANIFIIVVMEVIWKKPPFLCIK